MNVRSKIKLEAIKAFIKSEIMKMRKDLVITFIEAKDIDNGNFENKTNSIALNTIDNIFEKISSFK